RTIHLDERGFVAPHQGACAYFAILKPPGEPNSIAPPSGIASVLATLPSRLAESVRQGSISLQVAIAIVSGQRDANQLTNMIFYARHPELPPGYKIQPYERPLAREWQEIRGQIVQPLLGAPTGPAATVGTPGRSTVLATPVSDWGQVPADERMRHVM